jgi:hypothetical protein
MYDYIAIPTIKNRFIIKIKKYMIYIKTFESFSIDKNNIFNQSPIDVKNQLPWKGILSENDKFVEFFKNSSIDDVARENFLKIKDIPEVPKDVFWDWKKAQ